MKKSLVAFGAMAAATVATLFTMRQYRLWQEEEIERLEAGSHVVKTPLGLVEYSVLGEGPTVLIAHGSPGGYDQSMAIARFLNDSRFSFICMSRPGYLRTPLATGQTPEEQADMYAALLNTWEYREPPLQVYQAVALPPYSLPCVTPTGAMA